MKMLRFAPFITAVLVLAWIAPISAQAPINRDEPTKDAIDWQFTITAKEKETIFVDQPLRIDARLLYKGQDDFKGFAQIADGFAFLTIWHKEQKLFLPISHLRGLHTEIDVPDAAGRSYATNSSSVGDFVILYDYHRSSEFVFHSPGKYVILVTLMVFAGANADNFREIRIQSNPIYLEVVSPPDNEKAALELWRSMQRWKELIEKYPDSSYTATAKSLLNPTGTTQQLFPDDARLNAKITIDFPEQTQYSKILESYTKQTGVVLDASEEIKLRKMSSAKITTDLRSEMRRISEVLKASWERKEDKYVISKVR